MHKHRTKRDRTSRRMADANYRLDSTAKNAIMTLAERLPVTDGDEFEAVRYLKSEYLSKYCDEGLVPADERRSNAIAKFVQCELRNAETNLRLPGVDEGFNILPRVSWSRFIRFARQLTRDILGPLRDGVVLGGFSGGASTSRLRTASHPAQKFEGMAHTTEGAWKFLDIIYREAPLLRQYEVFRDLQEVSGSVLFTVPKKTDIDRCACKEPDVNMYLQKGVGNHIRRRLLRFNVNLNDQSVNRGLAKQGSLTGDLATLDLSSASDTISIEAVRLLLPYEWFEYLNDIRSHSVSVDGRYYRMEMFSSMGNGFTFELESLLFYALCRSVAYFTNTPGIVSIYGDDIVIPSEIANDVGFVLGRFGFSLNEEKSYSSGPFRESCGGHYRCGEDVTPFYLKRKPERLTDLIRVANQFRRWAMTGSRRYDTPLYHEMWTDLARHVPKSLWGGYDTSVDTQLVSPHPSRAVLARVNGKKDIPQKGNYVLWHNSNWNRGEPIVENGFEPVSTIQKCRVRSAKSGAPWCSELFYEELR